MHKRYFAPEAESSLFIGLFRQTPHPCVNIHSPEKGCIIVYISTPSTQLSTIQGTGHVFFRSYPPFLRPCICGISGLNTQCIIHIFIRKTRNNKNITYYRRISACMMHAVMRRTDRPAYSQNHPGPHAINGTEDARNAPDVQIGRAHV